MIVIVALGAPSTTSISTSSLISPTDAVIVALPTATPVTFPFSTFAIAASLVDHAITPAALAGTFAAVKVIDAPTSTFVA